MIDVARVEQIVDHHGRQKEHLIAMLLDCQEEFQHLPREVIETVANRVGSPVTNVLGIATFFRAFSLKPVGRHPIHVCMGTACHVQGAPKLLEALERELKIKKGDTTDDMMFTLDTVNCLGCCALGPVMLMDGVYYSKPTNEELERLAASE